MSTTTAAREADAAEPIDAEPTARIRTTPEPSPTTRIGGDALPVRSRTPLRLVPAPTTDDSDRLDVSIPSRQIVQALVETLGGFRPVSQWTRWCVAGVYEQLLTGRVQTSPAGGSASPMPSPPPHPAGKVVSVRVSQPCRGVAEVAAHVRYGHRSRAVAARLELTDDRWLCTALQTA